MAITKEHKEEIVKSGLFGFVANKHYMLDKEDLVNIIKEFNDAVYRIDKEIEKQAVKMMLEELIEEDEENNY